ncbi:MAG: S41 family peptidase [Sediminibacterium sp.]
MKQIIYTLTFLLILSTKIFSQDNSCNCLDNLNKLINKTEENYAGFPSKINEATKGKYKKLVNSLKKSALNITTPKTCFYILKNYVRFFKDKHFVLSYSNTNDDDYEKITYSEEHFKKRLAKKQVADVEGIWINADSTLKLAIQKFPNNIYKAIVIQSQDVKIPVGLVYMTLTPSKFGFIAKEYNSFITTDVPAKQKGNLLQIWYYNMFGKVYPSELSNTEKEELKTWRDNNNGLNFQKLSSKTAYLKIPTFINNDDKILQLVSKNDSIIKTCDNLIVDLTGNGGGNTGWVSFLSYFMTNPIFQYDTYLRVTPENVKSKLADLEPFVVNPIPDDYKKYFPDEILAAYKKAYQELPTTKKEFYPIPGVTFPLDSVLAKPKKIALIVDNLCGSSAEYFFFISKQSKKTTTYGINTIGMMDYEGMSTLTPLPYDQYMLTIPIVKSSWADKEPIDQTGFKPDVLLDKIEQKNWIEFVQQDLEKK